MRTQIFNHNQVLNMLKRMAFQILERNFEASELVLASIEGQGQAIGDLLESFLKEISKVKISRVTVSVNKSNPAAGEVLLNPVPKIKAGVPVILVDDVLNSGRTLVYAMQPLLRLGVSMVQLAVLVDRSYKSFPVSANFIGTSLSTTLQEHVHVEYKRSKFSVHIE